MSPGVRLRRVRENPDRRNQPKIRTSTLEEHRLATDRRDLNVIKTRYDAGRRRDLCHRAVVGAGAKSRYSCGWHASQASEER